MKDNVLYSKQEDEGLCVGNLDYFSLFTSIHQFT